MMTAPNVSAFKAGGVCERERVKRKHARGTGVETLQNSDVGGVCLQGAS